MKRVFSSPDSAEVGLIKGVLESAGIECEIRNEAGNQEISRPDVNPEVWIINDADFDEATRLIEEGVSGSGAQG